MGWLPRTITRLIGGVKSVLLFASDDDSNWPKYQNPDGLKDVEAAFTGHVIAKIKVGTAKIARQQSINCRQASRRSQKCHAFRIVLSLICWVNDDFLLRNPVLGKSIKGIFVRLLEQIQFVLKVSVVAMRDQWWSLCVPLVNLPQRGLCEPRGSRKTPLGSTWYPPSQSSYLVMDRIWSVYMSSLSIVWQFFRSINPPYWVISPCFECVCPFCFWISVILQG